MANLTLVNVAPKNTADAHYANTSNPHSVTKSQVGLSNVDNTSDANKPVSTAQQTALDTKVDENAAITGATKTKITYDSKGLVTSGTDATTADIADSSNKRYVTDAQLTVIGNTSGTNSGNETTTTIGSLINGATDKATPVDADYVGLMDSAASNILKKLSWANIKATLKAYFDTLYLSSALTSEIAVDTGNGHGSTNNKIRRLTTVRRSVGTDITYADSATLGASFTINVTGNYFIGYSDLALVANTFIGVSANSNQLTTAIYSITQANILFYSESSTGRVANGGITVRLTAGDIVRPHTDGVPNGTSSVGTMFIIKRVS